MALNPILVNGGDLNQYMISGATPMNRGSIKNQISPAGNSLSNSGYLPASY